jgi:hypothetical protein
MASATDPGARQGGQIALSFREELHAIEAVLAGQGIVLCSDVVVADDLSSGSLVIKDITFFYVARQVPGMIVQYVAQPPARALILAGLLAIEHRRRVDVLLRLLPVDANKLASRMSYRFAIVDAEQKVIAFDRQIAFCMHDARQSIIFGAHEQD